MIVHCFEFEKVELISGSTGKTDFEYTERLEAEKREFTIVRQHLSIGSRNKAFKTPILRFILATCYYPKGNAKFFSSLAEKY